MTSTATTAVLTTAHIDAAAEDDRYQGWGYPQGRSNQFRHIADEADNVLLDIVNGLGWDGETFFHWLNSKQGRWYGDLAFGNGPWLNATLHAAAIDARLFAAGFIPAAD